MRDWGRRRRVHRWAAAGCLVGVALTHATELGHKLEDAPYVGVLFCGLIATSLVLAALLLAGRALGFAWPAAGGLGLMAMGGYVVSRTVGLPQLADHVGHWLQAAGALSLVYEAALVVLAVNAEPRRGLRPGHFGRAASGLAAALLVFSAGATAQEAIEPGAPHQHDRAGLAHGGHHGPQYPDLGSLEKTQIAAARALLSRARRAAARRFPDYASARALGYRRFTGRGWKRPLVFHLRHPGYDRDDRQLDPERAESLVYWWPERGSPQLVAMMFRAAPETLARMPAVLTWHRHRNARTGRLGTTAMTHIWLTTDPRTAYATCLPREALEQAIAGFRYVPPRTWQPQESLPCTSTPPR